MERVELAVALGHVDARVLDPPVAVEELRAGNADARVGEGLRERLEPARVRNGVVVQEADELTGRELGALVARLREAAVLVVAHGDEVGPALEELPRAVGRAVVDDDHLGAGRGLPQRSEAALGQLEVVERRDDDRDARARGALPRDLPKPGQVARAQPLQIGTAGDEIGVLRVQALGRRQERGSAAVGPFLEAAGHDRQVMEVVVPREPHPQLPVLERGELDVEAAGALDAGALVHQAEDRYVVLVGESVAREVDGVRHVASEHDAA